jgi:UDP-glucose 4-epimerase
MHSGTTLTALVTGGGGFIGSHLVDRLLADGHRVRVVDNFATGRPENLSQHAGNPRLEVVPADITGADLAAAFAGVDWVFHLAALADIVPSIQTPEAYFAANVIGTFRVVQAARQAQVRRFVYAASSTCYGIPDVYPTPETADARPQFPYALSSFTAGPRRASGCSTSTGRAHARQAPTERCSACSWRRSWRACRSRSWATAPRRAISPL